MNIPPVSGASRATSIISLSPLSESYFAKGPRSPWRPLLGAPLCQRNLAVSARRVLIIVQNLPVPFDRRVWLEATTLQHSGFQVSVICPKLKGWNRSREVIDDIHIYRYALPIDAHGSMGYVAEFVWCFLCTALLSVRVAVSGRGFDVIHACNPPETYWLLGRAWGLLGKRFVFDHHDLSPEMYLVKFPSPRPLVLKALKWLERQTFRSAAVVITTNESHRQVAIGRGGLSPDRVYVVRSGPDLRRFELLPPEPEWRAGRKALIAYLERSASRTGSKTSSTHSGSCEMSWGEGISTAY